MKNSTFGFFLACVIVICMIASSPTAKTMLGTTRYGESDQEQQRNVVHLAGANQQQEPLSSTSSDSNMKKRQQEEETSYELGPYDFDDMDPLDCVPLQPSAGPDQAQGSRKVVNHEGRMHASSRLCQPNASRITFVPPNFPRSKCRVWVYLPDVPVSAYEKAICNDLKYRPNDGDIYKNIQMMDGYYVDYALIEIYKVHPCRIYSLEGVTNFNNVIGFIPVSSMTGGQGNVVDGALNAVKNEPILTNRGRMFMFMPSVVSPNPFKKIISKALMNINFVTHEVAMWDKKTFNNPHGGPFRKGYLTHFPKALNASVNCFRHALIPKVDWAVKTPLPVDADKLENQPNSTLLFISARVQSFDRIKLWQLARDMNSPRNFTFQTGRNVRETFSSGIANSVFCVDTTGDSLTTFRITNAVVRGCIPVLICDDCVFPFAKLFNYRIANNYEEMVESLKAAPFRSRYPTFAIRISQFNVLWKDSSMIIDMLYRLYHEERALVNKLYAGLQRVQKYFLSPFEKGSRYADALLEDMNIGATKLNYTDAAWFDYGLHKLCPY